MRLACALVSLCGCNGLLGLDERTLIDGGIRVLLERAREPTPNLTATRSIVEPGRNRDLVQSLFE
jgi:hypothetical protein